MTGICAGAVLPASTLSQPWFTTFAVFVALNTIIYVGLAASKLAPWPQQVHPDRVRAVLPPGMTKDTTLEEIPRSRLYDTDDEFARTRLTAATASIPLALTLMAGMVIIVSTVQLVFVAEALSPSYIASYAIALAMLVWAQVCTHARIGARVLIWSWSLLMTVLVLKLALDGAVHDNPVMITYATMILVITPVVSMSWPASLVTGIASVTGIMVGGIVVPSLDSLNWAIAALAAFGVGLIVLEVRRHGLDRLTLERMRSSLLTAADPLTGVLSRSGMLALADAIAEGARATGQAIHVALCDIDGMQRLNADYGIAYGDTVIASLARALEACSPPGTLLCRWEGDQFLLLGVGPAPEADVLAAEATAAIGLSGVALGKRDVSVSVATAEGLPGEATLESLSAQAAAALETTP